MTGNNNLIHNDHFRFSDTYMKYDDIIFLHGIPKYSPKTPNIDDKELFEKINNLKDLNAKPNSAFFFRLNKPFEGYNQLGTLVYDAIIHDVEKGDGGRIFNAPIIQMDPKTISKTIDEIYNGNLSDSWCDILFSNPSIIGLYYLSNQHFIGYNLNDLRKAQIACEIEKVYEIDKENGNIFETEWSGDKYECLKLIVNRNEIFNS